MSTPFKETQRIRRGHDFYPARAERGRIPRLRGTEEHGMDAVVWVHYFAAVGDWLVTELDRSTGEAFGWVDLGWGGEHGYFALPELEHARVYEGLVIVERDLDWEPIPLRDAITLINRRHGA